MVTRILLMTALLLSACSSDGDPAPADDLEVACQLFADALDLARDCDPAELDPIVEHQRRQCGTIDRGGPCVAEITELYLCLADVEYRCYPDSTGPIAPGVCQFESSALIACDRAHPTDRAGGR